jgi:hypothetical protein
MDKKIQSYVVDFFTECHCHHLFMGFSPRGTHGGTETTRLSFVSAEFNLYNRKSS